MFVRPSSLTRSALAVVAFGLTLPSAADATEGYFQHGYGARHKALGGAGAADSRDSTAISLNPAGLVHSGNEVTAAVSAFSPRREFEGGGIFPSFTPNGEVESDSNWFAIPNLSASYRLGPDSFFDVIGVSVYGSGGMNTDYPGVSRAPLPFDGVFLGGALGVDLQQALISVAVAKTIAPGVSVGVAPIIARQQIKLKGLGAFTQPGFSIDSDAVTNNGYDVSWGFGVRGGVEWAVTPSVRLGVAGNSPIWSQEFEKYRGLFAERAVSTFRPAFRPASPST